MDDSSAIAFIVDLVRILPGLWALFMGVSGLVGLYIVITCVSALAQDSRAGQQHHSRSANVIGIVAGTLMLSISTFVAMATMSLYDVYTGLQPYTQHTSHSGAYEISMVTKSLNLYMKFLAAIWAFVFLHQAYKKPRSPEGKITGFRLVTYLILCVACNRFDITVDYVADLMGLPQVGTQYFPTMR